MGLVVVSAGLEQTMAALCAINLQVPNLVMVTSNYLLQRTRVFGKREVGSVHCHQLD